MKVIICSIFLFAMATCWSILPASQGTLSSATATPATSTQTFDPIIRENFLNLLKIDPTCLFPCWQDLELGESTIAAAEQFGYEIFGQQGWHTSIQDTKSGYPYGAIYSFDFLRGIVADGVVGVVSLRANEDVFSGLEIWYLGFDTSTNTQTLPNEYLIENVVNAYGQPDDIWLGHGPENYITFVYSGKGLFIEYGYVSGSEHYDPEIWVICPDIFSGFTLIAYNPADYDPSGYYAGFRHLDTTTAISADEFIGLIMEHRTDTGCIQTPQSIWHTP